MASFTDESSYLEYSSPNVDYDEPEQPQKKKRKAWGQPVPPINPILPPRKRAKTAEEKEQRKNERILRNRRAADKSRQRQKAAVADLETTNVRMEEENATLRKMLEAYRSKFGEIDGMPFDPATPASLPIKSERTDAHATPMSYSTDYTPSVAPDSPVMAPTMISPLAPNLFSLENEPELMDPNFTVDFSGMTQYPAAMLCDLQCLPEMTTLKLPPQFNQFLLFLYNLNLSTIFESYSNSILLPLFQIFQILAGVLPTSMIIPTFSQILTNHFYIIHFLISRPSPTTPHSRIFRTMLLSRLLACNPKMARLLLAATDRELQRVVDQDKFAQDPEARSTWASLLTMKWVIIRLEREHRRVRMGVEREKLAGVDYGAVERSSGLWTRPRLERGMDEICTAGTEQGVH